MYLHYPKLVKIKHRTQAQLTCSLMFSSAGLQDWRSKFNGAGAPIAGRPRPFLFVELAPYTEGVGEPGDQSTALVRAAQMSALKLPVVAMAAAYDYGDPNSPLGNIHPEYKAPVGLRLSLAAQALAYSVPVTYKNPSVKSITAVGNNKLVITFDVPVEVRSEKGVL